MVRRPFEGGICTVGRFRFVWAVENTFDPGWAAVEEAPAASQASLSSNPTANGSSDKGHEKGGGGAGESHEQTCACKAPVPLAALPSTSRDSHANSRTNSSPLNSATWEGLSTATTPSSTPDKASKAKKTVTISLEYGCFVAILLSVIFYGFNVLRKTCEANLVELGFPALVVPPFRVFAWLFGSVGRDAGIDRQWVGYSFFAPVLAFISYVMAVALQRIRRCQGDVMRGSTGKASHAGLLRRLCSNPNAQAYFHVAIGGLFIVCAHQTHVIFPLLIVSFNYVFFTALQRCRRVPYWFFMGLMWVFHVTVMFMNEYYEGYEYFRWVQWLLPTEGWEKVYGVPYKPLIPRLMRWHIAYRMYVLRMIAFNYDMWEANRNPGPVRERALAKHVSKCIECARLREQEGCQARSQEQNNHCESNDGTINGDSCDEKEAHAIRVAVSQPSPSSDPEAGYGSASPLKDCEEEGCWCYKLRTEYPRESGEYSYINYLAYLLFCPLYLAGPISSFNAFVSCLRSPSRVMTRKDMWVYAVRIAFTYIVLETLLHTVFLNALTKVSHVIHEMSPASQAFFVYFYLGYLYLKFNFIWKTSRLFALWCGMETPENMPKCFSNNCFTRDFWRSWHAGLNLWIVRYMYIPMGGQRNILLSIFPIFFFIAIWHDLELHLLKWASLIILLLVVEVLVGTLYGKLARAFGREMDRMAGFLREEASHSAETPNSTPRESIRGGGGSLWSTAARLVITKTTPHQREYAERVLTSCAGVLAAFAQILANTIGYSIQGEAILLVDEEGKIPNTEGNLSKMLRLMKDHGVVCCTAACFLYALVSLGVLFKKKTAVREREAKKHYGLS